MPRKSPDMGPMHCEECGAEVTRRNVRQRYCEECSAQKDRERKAAWAVANPAPYTEAKKLQMVQRLSEVRQAGVDRSELNREGVLWMVESPELSMSHVVRLAIPFDFALSKNAIWRNSGKGHVYNRREHMAVRDAITLQLRQHSSEFYDGKVWIDLFIEKPSAKGDAINFVDGICDAIKKGIGIDDNWFCIRRLDWAIVKREPRIYIGIGQEVTEHQRACSYCGTIYPLTTEHFNRSKSIARGFGRECKSCMREARQRRKEAA